MKQVTINTYSASELKEVNLKGFERALDEYRNDAIEVFWSDEIMSSLKAVFNSTDGVYLKDYSIQWDYPNQSWVRLKWNNNDAKELSGSRAMAWLENNLLSYLRIGFNSKDRWNLSKYGKYYRAGMIKPCPFTGICYDEDFLESLQNDIKSGETLESAFENLACKAGKLIKLEYEDQMSESYFIDHSDANQWTYDIDGHLM